MKFDLMTVPAVVAVVLSGVSFVSTAVADSRTPPVAHAKADANAEATDDEPMTINRVMRLAMTQRLCEKVIKNKASQQDVEQLAQLFRHLQSLSPPSGTQESWDQLTQRMVIATESIARGESAHDELRSAANCTTCHRAHRAGKK